MLGIVDQNQKTCEHIWKIMKICEHHWTSEGHMLLALGDLLGALVYTCRTCYTDWVGVVSTRSQQTRFQFRWSTLRSLRSLRSICVVTHKTCKKIMDKKWGSISMCRSDIKLILKLHTTISIDDFPIETSISPEDMFLLRLMKGVMPILWAPYGKRVTHPTTFCLVVSTYPWLVVIYY
jgi:hypothetical protein